MTSAYEIHRRRSVRVLAGTAPRRVWTASRTLQLLLACVGLVSTVACSTTKTAAETTLAQGRTLTDLQYRQVLDNLAMFRKFAERNDTPLPWNLKFTNVIASVADSVSPTFSFTWPAISRTLTTAGTRQWQIQWAVAPETDHAALAELQRKYSEIAADVAFGRDFAQGSAPGGAPYGEYEGLFVWPKDGHISALNKLVLSVLEISHVKPEERNLVVPLR